MCNGLEVLLSLNLRNPGRKNWLAVTACREGSTRGRIRESPGSHFSSLCLYFSYNSVFLKPATADKQLIMKSASGYRSRIKQSDSYRLMHFKVFTEFQETTEGHLCSVGHICWAFLVKFQKRFRIK